MRGFDLPHEVSRIVLVSGNDFHFQQDSKLFVVQIPIPEDVISRGVRDVRVRLSATRPQLPFPILNIDAKLNPPDCLLQISIPASPGVILSADLLKNAEIRVDLTYLVDK